MGGSERSDLRFIPGAASQRLGQGGTDRAGQQQRKQQLGISLQGEHEQGTEQGRAIGGRKQGGGADGRQQGLRLRRKESRRCREQQTEAHAVVQPAPGLTSRNAQQRGQIAPSVVPPGRGPQPQRSLKGNAELGMITIEAFEFQWRQSSRDFGANLATLEPSDLSHQDIS